MPTALKQFIRSTASTAWDAQADGNTGDAEHATAYTYDDRYNLPLSKTYKTNSATVVTYRYNAHGDVVALVGDDTAEYDYDAFGNC